MEYLWSRVFFGKERKWMEVYSKFHLLLLKSNSVILNFAIISMWVLFNYWVIATPRFTPTKLKQPPLRVSQQEQAKHKDSERINSTAPAASPSLHTKATSKPAWNERFSQDSKPNTKYSTSKQTVSFSQTQNLSSPIRRSKSMIELSPSSKNLTVKTPTKSDKKQLKRGLTTPATHNTPRYVNGSVNQLRGKLPVLDDSDG